jgi:ubiquinone/menaquinone biosynthesis C-methylase UbiE
MPTVQELYGLWAGESELRDELQHSLEPRGSNWLFELFASLGPERGQLVVDVGARDARHAIRLVREHGLRAIALDPLPLHAGLARTGVTEAGLEEDIEVVEAPAESMPIADATADWIWCRDVLVHVDAAAALAECARVLRPGGTMVAYVTLASERLEPRERAELVEAVALAPAGLERERLEAAAAAAGLVLRSAERLGSEWRERMIEDGEWQPSDDLLRLARLRRREGELAERHGAPPVAAAAGGLLWGVYQLLGKLCPTVYVWQRNG